MLQTPSDRPGYAFHAEPRALKGKAKFREPVDPALPHRKNLMHDPRIRRGNTWAAAVEREQAEQAQAVIEKQKTRKNENVRGAESREVVALPPMTPPAQAGRKHASVETERYLEELVDRVLEEDIGTQTEATWDKPAPVLFVPSYSGVHQSTQVEEGELFSFELEVIPILEVLLGKCIEQSLTEVLEEEELKSLKTHQSRFEQMRQIELAEMQRLEAAERRRTEERSRRIAQEKARVEKEREVATKLAARSVAKEYLFQLQQNVFIELTRAGVFFDPVEKEVSEGFMPWLVQEVGSNLKGTTQARVLVNDVLEQSISSALTENEELIRKEEEARKLEEEQALEEARRIESERLAALEKARLEEEAERLRIQEEEEEESKKLQDDEDDAKEIVETPKKEKLDEDSEEDSEDD